MAGFHPTFIGRFSPDRRGYHADISQLFDHESLAITGFEKSLKYDVALLRSSPAVPKHVRLYGFFYEISSGELTEVVRDIPASGVSTSQAEALATK
ncbi:MAG TPA: hypothetical protein VME17_16225 [Bryobacteraceae bacterium]|nr:hypothetical protein [Bryobacteraceae bacterium]